MVAPTTGSTLSKALHIDALNKALKVDFAKITDHWAKNTKVALDDAIMSAFAMFHLKDQSLLAFDERRRWEPENLHTVYGVANIPCDSQMRTILMRLIRPCCDRRFAPFSGGCSVARSWSQ